MFAYSASEFHIEIDSYCSSTVNLPWEMNMYSDYFILMSVCNNRPIHVKVNVTLQIT